MVIVFFLLLTINLCFVLVFIATELYFLSILHYILHIYKLLQLKITINVENSCASYNIFVVTIFQDSLIRNSKRNCIYL